MIRDGQLLDRVDMLSVGELNFLLSTIINKYLSTVNYSIINDVVGVLNNVKTEFYRCVVAPYEEKKRKENGDVYCVDND